MTRDRSDQVCVEDDDLEGLSAYGGIPGSDGLERKGLAERGE